MEYLKVNQNVCRICLGHDITISWNDDIDEICGISYKDCYYKYTQLMESDSDPFPTNLCEVCANELKNSHLLFKKALESFKILQVSFKAKVLQAKQPYAVIRSSQPAIQNRVQTFQCNVSNEISAANSPTEDKTLIDIEEEIFHTNVYDANMPSNVPEMENVLIHFKEECETKSTADVVEPVHFIEIPNYESSGDDFLEPKSNKHVDAVKKINSLSETLLKDSQCVDTKSAITKRPGEERRKSKSSAGTSQEPKLGDNSGTKASVTLTTNNGGKIRKKNLLMCAYCSLKVDGNNQLKKHEATHSENRKRTETCPQCGLKLYTKLSLHNHMKVHDVNRQKKYKCEFCEKAFFNRGALNVHRRIHLGLMVTCQICSKEYYRQVDLNKHLRIHSAAPLQQNVEKKKYVVQCQYCDKSVLTSKWKEHKAAHLNQPQVKCKLCDKNFFAKAKCTQHLQRLHRKATSECEQFIHYYVHTKTRLTNLIIKQQEKVELITV